MKFKLAVLRKTPSGFPVRRSFRRGRTRCLGAVDIVPALGVLPFEERHRASAPAPLRGSKVERKTRTEKGFWAAPRTLELHVGLPA